MKKSDFNSRMNKIKAILGIAGGIGAELVASEILNKLCDDSRYGRGSKLEALLKLLGRTGISLFVGLKASEALNEGIDSVGELVGPMLKLEDDEEDDI